MKKKLLNMLKNLIIILTLVFIFINISATSVFADTSVGIDVLMREKISGWYLMLRNLALALMLVALFLVGFRLFIIATSARDKALFKKLIPDWIVGAILIFFIHYFMYAMISLNESIVDKAKSWGMGLSGLNLEDNTDGEITLYESSMSKAYELKFTSGTIGMIMYMMLVVYTYKFIVVYAKRYINVIILILLAPILLTIDSFKKLISGANDRLMNRWLKEFIYNVFIQSVHAIFYATLIGLTLRLSENTETFIGAILTLLIFGFIFKLDGLIRKIFNFVGGKNTIKQVDVYGSVKRTVKMGVDFKNGEGALYDKIESIKDIDTAEMLSLAGNYAIKFKDNAIGSAKNTMRSLDGKNIKVTAEEIAREKEKMENPNLLRKIHVVTQGVTVGALGKAYDLSIETSKFIKEKYNNIKKSVKADIEKLQQNVEMAKRLPKLIKAHQKSRNQPALEEHEVSDVNQTVVDLEATSEEMLTSVKSMLESESEDLVAEVYKLEGPQAFLYPETGSPYMGMSVLAVTKYESRYAYAYMDTESVEKRTLSAPEMIHTNDELDDEEEEDIIVTEDGTEVVVPKKNKSKRYKFNRFNAVSTRAIVQHLNSRIVFSDKNLNRINQVRNKLDLGVLKVSGNVGFRRTLINYTARMRSARSMKQQMDISLQTFEQRVQDGRWAQAASVATDIKMTTHNKISAELLKIMQAPAVKMAVNRLTDMGIVEKIDDHLSLVFERVGDKALRMVAPVTNFAQSIRDNITTKVQIVQAVIDAVSDVSSEIKFAINPNNQGIDRIVARPQISVNKNIVKPQIFVNKELGQHIIFNAETNKPMLINSVTGEQIALEEGQKIVVNEETGIPMIVNIETGEQIMFNQSLQDVITGLGNTEIVPNALLSQQLLISNETGQHIIFNAEIGQHILVDVTTGEQLILDENSNKQLIIDEQTGQTVLIDKETSEKVVFNTLILQDVGMPNQQNTLADKLLHQPIFVNQELGQHIIFNAETNEPMLINSATGEQIALEEGQKIVVNEETRIPMIVNVETGEQIMFNQSLQDVITGLSNTEIMPNALLSQQLLINNESGQHIIFNEEIGQHILVDVTTGEQLILDENSNQQLIVDEQTGQTVLVDKETGEKVVFNAMLMQEAITTVENQMTVPMVQSILGMNSENSIVNIVPASVIEAHPMVETLQSVGVIKQEEIIQFVVTENGEVVQQVLDLDGNLVQPAQAEDGNILANTVNQSGQIVQHIMSMEGTIVQQIINVNKDGTTAVVAPQVQADGQVISEVVPETSYEVKTIVEEMRTFVFEQVSTNLTKITQTGEVQTQILDIAQMVNEIGNVEITPVQAEERMADLDNLISQIMPELVEVSSATREPEKRALEMPLPNVPQDRALETITDRVIIETAIESEVYNIKDLDIQNSEETKLRVLDSLVEKGVVSTQVKYDEVAREEIIEVMEERKKTIVEEQPDAVFDALVQRDFANAVRSDISTGAITPDTISEISVEKHMDSLSEALAKAALAKVKAEIKDDVKKIEKVVKEEVATAKRVYGGVITPDTTSQQDTSEKKSMFKNRDTKPKQDKGDEYTKDDVFTVYISGAVERPGKVKVKIGARIRDAVHEAGPISGVTDWDGLDIWLKQEFGIDKDTPINKDMMTIWVPRIQDREDDDVVADGTAEMLDRCRPVVEKTIKDYITENNIKDPETLRKLMHRNMIVSELQKSLKRENITRKQIEDLIEERIRQVKAIRTAFTDAKNRARIVKNDEAVVRDEDVTEERKREVVATANTEDELTEGMVDQVVVTIGLQKLLKEINQNGERVLSNSSAQQERRARYMDEDPYIMMNNLLGTNRRSGMA